MATNPSHREEPSTTDPPPSISPTPPTTVTLPFLFPIPITQTIGSTTLFSLPGTSATSLTLQQEQILQLQTLLAALQIMFTQQSISSIITIPYRFPNHSTLCHNFHPYLFLIIYLRGMSFPKRVTYFPNPNHSRLG